ncbi:hypothetical protein ANACOL_02277 [Anaerotruncus colihominis DSM 17241]|uniref:Uncharacterized protein n=1 Tax=Anaerotruncus colihominis DSM 17241 TaxID=445972 RepID=B0PBW9_9FIRM|nr:hypothetical protein ANACOL_02277 [Anaerotruncus colihominis DSM 17241]
MRSYPGDVLFTYTLYQNRLPREKLGLPCPPDRYSAHPAGRHVKKEVEEKREKVMNKGWRMSLLFILEDTPPFLLEWFQYTGRM